MLTLDHITSPITVSDRRPLYTNDLLSVSRLKRYEQCPKAFDLHYIQRLSGVPGVPLVFGNLCHDALEQTYEWVLAEKFRGPFPKDRLLDRYQVGFEQSGLTQLAGQDSPEVFEEGRSIMSDYASRNGIVDHHDHVATELKFEIEVGPWRFIGFIDRVDGDPNGQIIIRDYKTNRVLFSQHECDSDLQASIYHVAARTLFPNATDVTFVFDMLRHGVEIETRRDEDQLDSAVAYCKSLARQSENNTEYPAQMNTYCAWCDHRSSCDKYQDALALEPGAVAEMLAVTTPEGMEQIAKERERVTHLAKLFDQRKKELEKHIKAIVRADGPVHAGGMRYSEFKTRRGRHFPEPDRLLSLLVEKDFGSREELQRQLTSIDTKKVDALVKKHSTEMSSAEARMLKLEIDSVAKVGYSTRFDARKDKDK